jgi:hypothetical protein
MRPCGRGNAEPAEMVVLHRPQPLGFGQSESALSHAAESSTWGGACNWRFGQAAGLRSLRCALTDPSLPRDLGP